MSAKRIAVNKLEGPITDVPVEMPQRHAYVKCPGCRRIIDQELLEQALDVCPRCGHHLRLSARKRLEATVDKDSFEAWFLDIPTPDPLAFPGYQEKLAAAKGG